MLLEVLLLHCAGGPPRVEMEVARMGSSGGNLPHGSTLAQG